MNRKPTNHQNKKKQDTGNPPKKEEKGSQRRVHGDTPSLDPANLIPPPTTKHASALSVDGTPSLARCRDNLMTSFRTPRKRLQK